MMGDEWIAWVAGIIDGEGSISFHKAPMRSGSFSYVLGLKVGNTDLKIVEKCKEIMQVGTIAGPRSNGEGRKPMYVWAVSTKQSREVLRRVMPYLIGKRLRAEIALRMPKWQGVRGHPMPAEVKEEKDRVYQEMIAANKRGV